METPKSNQPRNLFLARSLNLCDPDRGVEGHCELRSSDLQYQQLYINNSIAFCPANCLLQSPDTNTVVPVTVSNFQALKAVWSKL